MQFHLPSGVSLGTAWCSSAPQSKLDSELDFVMKYFKQVAAARNARSPLLKLAPELLHLIIDYTHSALAGPQAVRSCSLVCSALLPFAQARLYSELVITKPEHAGFAGSFSTLRPDLLKHARSLKLREVLVYDNHGSSCSDHDSDESDEHKEIAPWENHVSIAELAATFRQLTHVCRLKFIAPQHKCDESLLLSEARLPVLEIFSQITDLTLTADWNIDYENGGHCRYVCGLLRYFPNIRCLTIQLDVMVTTETLCDDWIPDKEADDMDDDDEYLPCSTSWSTISDHFPNLRHMRIAASPDNLDDILSFVDKLKKSLLQSLAITVWRYRTKEPLRLSHIRDLCYKLYTTGIMVARITYSSHVSSGIHQELEEAGCPRIQHINHRDPEPLFHEDIFDIVNILDFSVRLCELHLGRGLYTEGILVLDRRLSPI